MVTAAVLVIVVVTKFAAGAWLSLGMIGLMAGSGCDLPPLRCAVDAALDIPPGTLNPLRMWRFCLRVYIAIVYVERVRRPAVRALSYARAGRALHDG